jgi:type II secretory pathway pseudopilin PulG
MKENERMSHKGLTIIEALAGILILSFVMVGTMTILINSRTQSKATEEYLIASQVGIMLSNYVTTYMTDEVNSSNLESFMDGYAPGVNRELNYLTCGTYFGNDFCDTLYNQPPIGGRTYNHENIMISVVKPIHATSIIKVTITINYFSSRMTSVEAFVYV